MTMPKIKEPTMAADNVELKKIYDILRSIKKAVEWLETEIKRVELLIP
jgi:hypothetical protein